LALRRFRISLSAAATNGCSGTSASMPFFVNVPDSRAASLGPSRVMSSHSSLDFTRYIDIREVVLRDSATADRGVVLAARQTNHFDAAPIAFKAGFQLSVDFGSASDAEVAEALSARSDQFREYGGQRMDFQHNHGQLARWNNDRAAHGVLREAAHR
jgi:hypothetical protein